MDSTIDKRSLRKLKQAVVKQKFREFSIAAGQLPTEIVVLQRFEYIGDEGQPGNRLVGFNSEEDVYSIS